MPAWYNSTALTKAIDCLVNVDLGDTVPPEWLVRVKEDTFQGGDAFLRSVESPELLDDMDANGVARAILMTRLDKAGDRAQRYAAERPDRFALGVGGLDLLRPMPTLAQSRGVRARSSRRVRGGGYGFSGDGMYSAERRGVLPAVHEVL